MIKIKSFLLILTFSIFYLPLLAQQNKIDSLLEIVKTAKEDTNEIKTLNTLAWELKNKNLDTAILLSTQALKQASFIASRAKQSLIQLTAQKGIANSYYKLGTFNYIKGNYSLALDFYFKALKIGESLNNKKGISLALSGIGLIYDFKSDYLQALSYDFRALKITEELKDKPSQAENLSKIGGVYLHQGDYPKGLNSYLKALQIAEESKDKTLQANNLDNIGNVYSAQNDYPKALSNYLKALQIAKELKDESAQAINLTNIGVVYSEQNEYTKALDYSTKALKMFEELGNKRLQERVLSNIGNVYEKRAEAAKSEKKYILSDSLYDKTLDYYYNAMKLSEQLKDKIGIINQLTNVGIVYTHTNKYKKAEEYLEKALMLSTDINALNLVKEDQQNLSELYEQIHQPVKALEHYKKYIQAKDSIFNKENTKKMVRFEMNFDFDKKQAEEKALQDKKDAIAAEELKQQRLQRNYFIIGFALVLLLAIFIFRSYRQKQKANNIITEQKSEVEKQKKVVEEKNKDILDSIHYAKRIQDALLKEEEHVSKHLPEHFILFIPKDIVSGDFYWAREKQGYWYIAAVDCTGHGVPGAFMSMLGMSFLNDIISTEQLLSPAEILNQLRDKVVKELRQKGEAGGSKDGMDISLIRIDLSDFKNLTGLVSLQYAGANNALNLICNSKFVEIKADKQPIGYHPESKPFTNHEIQIEKGDSIYIFSDGYADQFGGPKGKKFKYKQLEELVLANNHLPMEEQQQLLKKTFIEWRGQLEQVDDVCVIGVKI